MMILIVREQLYLKTSNPIIIKELKKELTKANPDFAKKRRMGYSVHNTIPNYHMYNLHEDMMIVPRGAFPLVKALCKKHKELLSVKDCTTRDNPIDISMVKSFTPYFYQKDAIESMIDNVRGNVIAPCGCLTGDTIVNFNRCGKGFKTTLEKAYKRWNGIDKHLNYNWDKTHKTYIRSFNIKRFILNEVEDILYSGEKEVFELILDGGKIIKGTADHKILTSNGWKRLDECLDEYIVTDVLYPQKSYSCREKNKDNGNIDNFNIKPVFIKAIAINYIGIQPTYDICCKAPYHNFVANGIVVHNSGKTVIALAYMAERKQRTLIIVHTLDLFKQWYQRIEEFLVGDFSIGSFGNGSKIHGDITIAMIQTLVRLKKSDWDKFRKLYSVTLFDECLPERTKVLLADGTYEDINKIVNQKMNVDVMSFNIEKNVFEKKKVVRWIKNKRVSPLMKIKMNPKTNRDSFMCTPNHKIYTLNKGYIPSKELSENDIIIIKPHKRLKNSFNNDFGPNQMQIVYGSILGDGHLSVSNKVGRLKITHSEKQFEYLKYKIDLLNGVVDSNLHKSGYTNEHSIYAGSSMSHRQLYDVSKLSPVEVFEKLDDKGLAILFGDNGSNNNERLSIHTERYTKEENEKFIEILDKKFGIEAKLQKSRDYYYIRMNKSGSINLALIVAQWLHPSLHYKLKDLVVLQNDDFVKMNKDTLDYCSWYPYIENVDVSGRRYDYVYNLEVEDNHNYCVSSNVVVSNSHHAGAESYITVMKNISSKYIFGMTATPNRTDKKDFLIGYYLGSIIHTINYDTLETSGRAVTCKVNVMNTGRGYNFSKMGQNFSYYGSTIAKDRERNEQIVDCIIKDLDEGKCPLVLTERVFHSRMIVSLLRARNIDVELIIGATDTYIREVIKDKMRENKIQVLVASKQIASEGLDIPTIDSVHICFWTTNISLIKQMIGRGRRVTDDKEYCRVWYYRDFLFTVDVDIDASVKQREYQSYKYSFIRLKKWFLSQGFDVVETNKDKLLEVI